MLNDPKKKRGGDMKKFLSMIMFSLMVVPMSGYALTIDSVGGDWSNVVSTYGYQEYVENFTRFLTTSVAYGDKTEDQVRWGLSTTPGGGPKSGLGFTGVSSEATFDFGEIFEIGQLRHFNYEIYLATAAKSVDFSMNIGLMDIPVALNFNFTFTIDETPNEDADGTKTPVDDIIGFSDATAIQTFAYDTTLYTFELLGFGDTPDAQVTQFISKEFSTSTTKLFGRLTAEPVVTPEPGTMLLVGGGLIGLAALRKRIK